MSADKVDGRSLRAKKKRESRKKEILQAAQKVIGMQGYQASSVSDIIKEANVSRGTFYLYFESMDAIFHELVDQFINQIMRTVSPVQIENGKPLEDILENIERVMEILFEHRDLTAILLREAISQGATVNEKLSRLYNFLYRNVKNALRNGAKWEILRPVDENIIAMAFIGSIKEVLYQYLVVQDQSKDVDRKKLAQELLAFGLRGLAL
ncbi:MAG: TetR/AcrR family transcriptional regulator [Bdellovibrionales bacterium]|nr:TetR/AcrR family transcriptional regulator [Bdellovibrionales bacterium]